MHATRRTLQALALALLCALGPSMADASGVGVSVAGHRPDSVASTPGLFWAHRPGQQGLFMHRDLEFHWDAQYPGDSAGLSAATRQALDSLGVALVDVIENPFGAPYADLRLVYNYFHLQGPYYDRTNPFDTTSVRLGLETSTGTYPDRDRSHADYYLARPGHLASDGNPPSSGMTPSEFRSTVEDTSTGSITPLSANSMHFTGPSEASLNDPAWTRAYSPQVWGFNHELQHALPGPVGAPNPPLNWSTEMFSAGAEAVAGVPHGVAATYEVPYTHSLLAHVSADNPAPVLVHPCSTDADRFYQSGYTTRRLFASYLAYNFRGVDTLAAIPASPVLLTGFGDDLLWRWVRMPEATGRTLAGLKTLLPSSAAYFSRIDPLGGQTTTLSGHDLLQLLHHNFRVANYLDAPAYGDGRYGYPPQFGFVPSIDVSAWKSFGTCNQDIMSIPPKLTLGTDWKARSVVRAGTRRSDLGERTHRMVLQPFGAEYWIVRSNATGGGTDRSLVLTIAPESADPSCFGGGRLMASVATYSDQSDSLWRHPEWIQEVQPPLWVDSDTLAGEISFVVPDFGDAAAPTRRLAAVATITAADAPWAGPGYSESNGLSLTQKLAYGLSAELASAPYPQPFAQPIPLKLPLVANAGLNDSYPTWAPGGQEIAYHSQLGTGSSQIYRRAFSASNLNQSQVPVHSVPGLNQYRPDWSPRGDWIVFEQDSTGSNCDLYLKNLQTGELRRVSSGSEFEVNAVFQPNGQGFAYAKTQPAEGGAHRWELRYRSLDGSTDVALVSPPGGLSFQSPRWELDGSHVHFTRADSLYRVRVADGLVEALPTPLGGRIASFDLARGAGLSIYENKGETIESGCPLPVPHRRLLATRTGLPEETRTRFHARRSEMLDPRISPDGTRAAFTQLLAGADADIHVGILTYDHAPRMNPGVVDQVLSSGVAYSINLATGASDPDGDPIHYRAAYLPPGSTFTGSTFSWPLPIVVGGEHVFHTVFVAYDSAGAQDYRVVRYEIGGGGGCPFADVLTGSGWIEGNSISSRSVQPAPAIDAYRLPAAPVELGGLYRLRIREDESEESTLLGVHLLVVDRERGARTFSLGERVVQGDLIEPIRVTNARGEEITSRFIGPEPSGVVAEPGEALVVEFGPPRSSPGPSTHSSSDGARTADEGGGFYLESGGKEIPPELRNGPGPELASLGFDERVLRLTGVDLQVPEGGDWQTVVRHYPRAKLDGATIGGLPTGPVRLVFSGRHELRAIGWVTPVIAPGSAVRVDPIVVHHSRLGDVRSRLLDDASGGVSLVLRDTLNLTFRAPASVEGVERDIYLVTRGSYRSVETPSAAGHGAILGATVTFTLGAARPNPSRGVTTIPFSLPTPSATSIRVFDASGRLVRTILRGEQAAGHHEVEWDRRTDQGARVSPGVYFYRLDIPGREATRKIAILGD